MRYWHSGRNSIAEEQRCATSDLISREAKRWEWSSCHKFANSKNVNVDSLSLSLRSLPTNHVEQVMTLFQADQHTNGEGEERHTMKSENWRIESWGCENASAVDREHLFLLLQIVDRSRSILFITVICNRRRSFRLSMTVRSYSSSRKKQKAMHMKVESRRCREMCCHFSCAPELEWRELRQTGEDRNIGSISTFGD